MKARLAAVLAPEEDIAFRHDFPELKEPAS